MSERVLEFLGRTDVWAVVAALAGFLSLTWMIRQAPLGQATQPEPSGAPSPSQRDRAVILGVVGFLAILLGGYLAVEVGIPVSIPAFAIGIGLIQWVLRTYRGSRHESPTIRRLIAFAETALTASLIAGVLLVGNVLAFRLGGRPIDLTHDQAFTLASQSLNQLKGLDRPVTLTIFFGNSERSLRQLDRVRQLVDLYHTANPSKVQVQYLDPYRDIKEFEALARRVPDVATSTGDGMVVTYGEGTDAPHLVLGARELFEAGPASGSDRYTSTFRGEDVITSTLIRLREGKRSKVAFTTGHGEPSTSEIDLNRPGYGLWRARLASVGSDVVDVNLLQDEVTSDVTLLVIGGPKVPFQNSEIDRVKQYLAQGGPILILADGSESTGLGDLLKIYNIEFALGVIADAKYHFNAETTIVYAPLVPNLTHPIVGPMVGQVGVLQNASPINILGPASPSGSGPPGSAPKIENSKPANPGIITSPILRTFPGAWAESTPGTRPVQFDRGKEAVGSMVVAVAATTRPALASEQPTPRLVLFSSPNLGDNRWLVTNPTNIDLLMNSVSWLRGKPELIGIAPKTHESLLFAADPGLQLRLVMVPTLVAGIIIVGLGLATYFARRD